MEGYFAPTTILDKQMDFDEIQTNLRNFHDSLKQENASLNKRVKDLEVEISTLTAENRALPTMMLEVEKAQRAEMQLNQELTYLKSSLDEKQKKEKELAAAIENLKLQALALTKDKQLQNQETLSAVEKYFKLEVENQKLKSDIEKLRRKQVAYTKLLNEKLRELEAAYQRLSQFTTTLSESEAKTQQLQDKIASFEAKQQLLNYTILDLENALADSRAQEEQSKKELQEALTATTHSHSEKVTALLNESKALRTALGKERDKHLAESTNFKNQITTLNKTVSDLKSEVSLLQFQLKEEHNKQGQLVKEFQTTLLSERKSWVLEKAKLQEASEAVKKDLQSKNELLKNEVASRDAKNTSLAQLLDVQTESFKLRLQESESQIKSLEEEKRSQAMEIAKIQEASETVKKELQSKNEILKNEVASREAKNSTLAQLLDVQKENFKLRLQESESQLKHLEEEKCNQAMEIANLNQTLGQLQQEFASVLQTSDLQKSSLETQKALNEKMAQDFASTQQKLTQRNDELAYQVSTLETDKLVLQTTVEELQQKIAKAQEEQKAMSARAVEREKQLEQYYNFVTAEKAKNQKVLKELARQIHYAVTMHPLRDYLLITEKELSRIESELKKTPIIAPHRPQLEAMVDQLIQQRDYIKDLIEKSEKSLSHHTAALERLAGGSLGAGAPPPPPLAV